MTIVDPTNRTPRERAELAAFSRTLLDLMNRRGMSQSDLARALWGTTTDNRGRSVAKNRDRISHYTRGTQMPEERTLRQLAEVLGVQVVDLVPALSLPESKQASDMTFSAIAGTDQAVLDIHAVLPLNLAMKLMAMVVEHRGGGGGSPE